MTPHPLPHSFSPYSFSSAFYLSFLSPFRSENIINEVKPIPFHVLLLEGGASPGSYSLPIDGFGERTRFSSAYLAILESRAMR